MKAWNRVVFVTIEALVLLGSGLKARQIKNLEKNLCSLDDLKRTVVGSLVKYAELQFVVFCFFFFWKEMKIEKNITYIKKIVIIK